MAESVELKAWARQRSGKGGARSTRREGRIPGILYGECGADGAPRQRQDQNFGYRWRATITAPGFNEANKADYKAAIEGVVQHAITSTLQNKAFAEGSR